MVQNKTWMRYLTIGIIGSCLLMFSACIKQEFSEYGEFNFINTTNHFISYNHGLDDFNLKPYEIKKIKEGLYLRGGVDASTYFTPFKVTDFDVTIKFDSLKCLVVSPNGDFGPLNIKNYISEKIDKRTYKFTYTFTEADYNRAVICP